MQWRQGLVAVGIARPHSLAMGTVRDTRYVNSVDGGRTVTSRLGRVTSIALLGAAAYALLVVVSGFVVPVYESSSGSSSGYPTTGSDTLVGVNGAGVVIVLVIPLIVSLLVGAALWQGTRLARAFAWTLTGLMVVLNLLAMLSVGIFFLPITVALIVACSTSHARLRPLRPAA